MNRKYDLLAIDLDGTLLGPDHRVSAANLRALERARGAGYRVTICTGRGWVECRDYARAIGQVDPVVVAGGAIVTCPSRERTLHRFPIDRLLVDEMARCMLEHGHAVLILKDPDATGGGAGLAGHDYVVVSPRGEAGIDPVSRWWFEQLKVQVKVVREVAEDEHPEHTVRVGICGPRAETTAAAGQIRERFGSRVQFHHFAAVAPKQAGRGEAAEVLIFEAFDRTVSKWTAIEWMAAREGLDGGRVVAIGNDVNDVAMLERAGLSIAMGNSVPEALAAAQRVTRRHDEDGVAWAVERVMGGEW